MYIIIIGYHKVGNSIEYYGKNEMNNNSIS